MSLSGKKNEVYIAKVKCRNCDFGYPYDDDMEVPKGMTFDQFSKQTECPDCGCKGTLYYFGVGHQT